MTQGIVIAKQGSSVTSRDPKNITADTRQIGGMKKLPIQFFNLLDGNYTETYTGPGPFGGTRTYGRIKIPHNFGFSPAFSGHLLRYSNGVAGTANVLPWFPGNSISIFMTSNENFVTIENCPMDANMTIGVAYTVAVTIFVENLDAVDI